MDKKSEIERMLKALDYLEDTMNDHHLSVDDIAEILGEANFPAYQAEAEEAYGGTPDWENLGLTLYRLALGMVGSMTFYLLSKPVCDGIRRWRWCVTLCRIGGATLGIYFLQTFLLEILVNRLQVYVPIPQSYWVAPLLAVAELALCYGLVLLLRKTRLLRLLILGEK